MTSSALMVGDGVPWTDMLSFIGDNTPCKTGPPHGRSTRQPARLTIQGLPPRQERSFIAVGTAPAISTLFETRMADIEASTRHKTIAFNKRKLGVTQLSLPLNIL